MKVRKLLLALPLGGCHLLFSGLGPEVCDPDKDLPFLCKGSAVEFCDAESRLITTQECGDALVCLTGSSACSCGDGDLDDEQGELCDDGNLDDGDGCDEFCRTEAVCGNGERENNEVCDDGNQADNDGCSADCLEVDTNCGDGVQENGETCDDGNQTSGDGCNNNCQSEEELFSCAEINSAALNVFPDNGTIIIEDECSVGPILIQNKTFTIKGANGGKFIGNSTFTINGTSKITFKDVDFNVNSAGKVFLAEENAQMVIINSTIINISEGNGSRILECASDAVTLLDQVSIFEYGGDRGVVVNDACRMIIANSVFAQSLSTNRDTIQILDPESKLQIFFSTFFKNSNSSEQGILDVAGSVTFCSVVASDNGSGPIEGNLFAGTSNFIKDEVNLAGNQNVDPLIDDTTFELEDGSPAIDNGDQAAQNIDLIFEPSDFGVDIFAHDRNNNPRPAGSRDAGAFEK